MISIAKKVFSVIETLIGITDSAFSRNPLVVCVVFLVSSNLCFGASVLFENIPPPVNAWVLRDRKV